MSLCLFNFVDEDLTAEIWSICQIAADQDFVTWYLTL